MAARQPPQPAMARAIGALVQAPPPARRRLPRRDQGDHGGERHLERGAGQRFGRDGQHDHRRPGDQPERQGRAVEQDGEQREARHGAGALRRHRGAGERGVEQRRHQREHGRDLLGVDAQARAAVRARCRSAPGPSPGATTNTMCRPEIDRMWASPESRIAWAMSLSTAVCSPARRAATTPPSGPGSAFMMRSTTSARRASMVRTKPSGLPGSITAAGASA